MLAAVAVMAGWRTVFRWPWLAADKD